MSDSEIAGGREVEEERNDLEGKDSLARPATSLDSSIDTKEVKEAKEARPATYRTTERVATFEIANWIAGVDISDTKVIRAAARNLMLAQPLNPFTRLEIKIIKRGALY